MEREIQRVISQVGSFAQLGSLLLITLLMAAIYRSRKHLPYLSWWTFAWPVYALALSAIVLRYSAIAVDGVPLMRQGETTPAVRLLYYIYVPAKFFFLALLVQGTRQFALRDKTRISFAVTGLIAVAVGLAVVRSSPALDRAMVLQCLVAVPTYAYCTFLLARYSRGQQSLGASLLTAAFGAHTLLWVLFGISFGGATGVLAVFPLGALANYNSYFDAVLQTVLGYAMVVIVIEETSREWRSAHGKLAQAHSELRQAAFLDPLSGVYNRHAFTEGVGLEGLTASTPGVVVILDVDHLKPVNDGLGHGAGDALLQQLARTMKTAIRQSDTLYRWGGDEFLIVMPRCELWEARPLIVSALNAAASVQFGGVLIPVCASFGCAEFGDPSDLKTAIQMADRSMYEAKTRRTAHPTPVVELPAVSGADPAAVRA